MGSVYQVCSAKTTLFLLSVFLILNSGVAFGQCPPIITARLSPTSNAIYDSGINEIRMCAGDTVILECSPAMSAGLTFEWFKGGVSLPGETSDSLVVTLAGNYQVRVSGGGCSDLSAITGVVVNTVPTVTITPNIVPPHICSGDPITMTVTTSPSTGVNWLWMQPAGIMGSGLSPLSLTLFANTTFQVVCVNTNQTPQCTNSSSLTVLVDNPIDGGQIAAAQTICAGQTPAPLTSVAPANGGGGTYTYAWFYSLNGMLFTPLGASGPTYSPGPLTESTYFMRSATSEPCEAGLSNTVLITVNPIPDITSPLFDTVCSGETFSYTPQSSATGVSYTWTASVTSGSVSGYTASGTGPISNILTLASGSLSQGEVTYVITPTGPVPTSCVGTASNLRVAVYPRGDVSNTSLSQTICAGGATAPVTLTSLLPGTSFSWVAAVPAGISMSPSSGTGNIPAITIYSTNIAPTVVDFTITPFGAAPVDCEGVSVIYSVTVNPSPTVTNSPLSQSVCSGVPTTEVVLTSNVAGTSFTWNAIADPPSLTGFTTSGTSTIPVQTISNPTVADGTVTYSILPGGTVGSCPASARDYVITVGALPSITSGLTGEVCSGEEFAYSTTSSVINTQFSWNRPAVSGITPSTNSGTNPQITETLTNSTTASIDVVYNLIPSSPAPLSCPGTTSQLVLTVRPLPVVDAGTDQNIPNGTSTTLAATASAETLPLSPILWTPALSIASGAGSLTPTTTNLYSNVQFEVSVTDGAGCQNSDIVLVNLTGTALTANPSAVPNPVCAGAATQLEANASGGSGSYTYTWSPASSLSATDIANPTATPAGTTTYTVLVSDGYNSISANVMVTVTPLPDPYTVSGGGHYCQGETGLSINLSDSDVGVEYLLLLDGDTVSGSSIFGDGSPLTWPDLTAAGTYTVVSSRNGCPAPMSGSAVIVIDPLPTAFTIVGGGTYPEGGTGVAIGLSSSQTNVNYTLELIGGTLVPPPAPISGTGSSISFGLQTTVGDYQIVAQDMLLPTQCANIMSGTASIATTPMPVSFNVTGGGVFCLGESGVAVGLSGSEVGITYRLMRNGFFVNTFSGTGSALSFGLFTITGNYTVTAENTTTGGITDMNGVAVVTQNPRPALYSLIPAGNQCPGTELFLNGTEAGVNYELQYNGVTISTIAGTGVPGLVSLGIQTVPGSYTVIATISATGCTRVMNGTTVIVVPPQQFSVIPAGIVCQDEGIWLEESEVGISYQLIRDGLFNSGIPIIGTGGPLNFGAPNFPGVYTVRGVDPATSCAEIMIGSATLYPLPVQYSIIPHGDTCAPIEIGLGGSQVGFTYWLQLNGNFPPEVILPGTGSPLNFGLRNLAGNYTVRAVSDVSQCVSSMANVLTLLPRPQIFNLTLSGIACAGDAIGLDGSEPGMSYQLLLNDTVLIGTPVSGTGSGLSFGVQLLPGNYSVMASNPSTLCSEIMNGVATLIANPSVFSITPQGSFCTGIEIGLNGSQTGITYQLIRDNLISTPVAQLIGTGSVLNFGVQNTAGNYVVIAVNSLTGCESSMIGSTTLLPRPLMFDILPAGVNCEPIAVSLSGSQAGVSYELLRNGLPLVPSVIMAGTGSSLNFGLQYQGIYTVQGVGANGCPIVMNGSVSITGLPVVSAGVDLTVCPGEDVALAGSASNQSSVLWITTGDGTFDDATQLSAIYYPAPTDVTVVLQLRAYGISACGSNYTTDDLTLTINRFSPGSILSNQTVCEGEIPVPFTSVPASGSGVFSYLWLESSTGMAPWATAGGTNNTETYSPPLLVADRWYKRQVSSVLNGITCSSATDSLRISVNNLTNGTVVGDQTICEESVPATLTGPVPTADGTININWMQSADGTTWVMASGSNSNVNYDPPALNADMWYKRVVNSMLNGEVCTVESNVVKITVINFTQGSVAASQTICEGDVPTPFTSVAPAGDGLFTYQWMESPNGTGAWVNVASSGNGELYAPPALSADTWYKRVVMSTVSGITCSLETNVLEVTVINFVSGSVSADQTICEGTAPAPFASVPPAGDGTISMLWMESTDGSTGWVAAAGVNTQEVYQPPVLFADMWYKRVAMATVNGITCTSETNILHVSVNYFDPGSIAGDQTICEGTAPAPFTSVTPAGSGTYTYLWQQSADGITGWADAPGVNSLETYSAPVLVADTWYKRIVTSLLNGTTCVAETNYIGVTVINSNPGSVAIDQTICEGEIPLPFSSVPPAGDGVFTYLWQESADGMTGWSDAAGANTLETYAAPSLMEDNWYKRIVTSTLNGTACVEETNLIAVTVNNIDPGTIAADQTICEGDTPASLIGTPATADGIIDILWQQSADGTTGWTDADGVNNTVSYSPPALIADTWYKRIVTSELNGIICSGETSTVHIAVNNLNPGSIAVDQTICEGNAPAPFTSVPATGNGIISYRWMQSPDGMSGWVAASGVNNGETYTAPVLTTDRWYKRVVTSSLPGKTCMAESNIIRMTVNSLPTAFLSGDAVICEGESTPLSVVLTGTPPWSIDYFDGTTTYTIGSIMASPFVFDVMPVVNTSYSLSAVSDAYCGGISFPGTAAVTVNPIPFAYQLTGSGDGSYCAGGSGIELILNGSQTGISYTLMFGLGSLGTPVAGTGSPISFGYVTNPGTYYVVATDVLTGCFLQMPGIIHVTVYPIPLVNFHADTACLGAVTQFTLTGSSLGGIVETIWNFGDGYTATFSGSSDPTHTYLMAGVFTVTMVATDTNGCQRTVAHNVKVQDSPVALFTWDNPNCSNSPVHFTNLSYTTQPDYIVEWVYNFGDGSDPDTIHWPGNPSISHLYPASGSYNVTLTVWSNNGCIDSLTREINITPQPVVDFSYMNGCQGGLTLFTDLTQLGVGGTVQEWYWNFGNPASGSANLSNLRNPAHTYNTPGTYLVSLIVITSQGCADTVVKPVIVKPKPTALFEADTVCQGLETQFTDLSAIANSVINSWDWDFGDGQTHSNQQNPSHLYAEFGTYQVTLAVTDTAGCVSDTTMAVPVYRLPYAAFTNSGSNCAGNEVSFTSLAATQQGYLTQWIWIYGDGEQDTINYPTSPNTIHSYALPNTYTVTLKVVNSNGCMAEVSHQVAITANPLANFTFPAANCEESTVLFTDASQSIGGIPIINREWNFGDIASGSSNTSYQQNPVHIFMNPGTYTVTLMVSTGMGCSDTVSYPVIISDKPLAQFTADTACLGGVTTFINQSIANSGVLTTYDWDFGDGTLHSNNANPTHTYTSAGLKQVTLIVNNSNGCTSSVTQQVMVAQLPMAAFIPSTQNCTMSPFLFDDQSTSSQGYIVQWQWNFDDGDTVLVNFPALPDVSHQYAMAGTYNVTLTVVNTLGCESSVSIPVVVQNNPAASFSASGSTCQGMAVLFTDLSQTNGAGPLVTWNWLFDDPGSGVLNTSSLQNPMHIFSSADTFNVRLIVSNINGCIDTIVNQVVIGQAPSARFVADSVCFTNPTQFADSTTSLVPVVSWLWNFGDGGSSTIQNPLHTYQNWGNYNVSLIVTNASGCQSDTVMNVFVKPLPTAIFNYAGICAHDGTQFTDISVTPAGTIETWLWDFGDGGTSTEQNPLHTFATGGNYFVSLTVTNSFGCDQFLGQSVNISNKPAAAFNYYTVFCPGGQVTFQDMTQGNGSPVTTRVWDFGDGFSSTAANPVYTYQYPDSCYTVRLIVNNAAGCQDTSIQQVCVKPESSFTIAVDPGCAGHPTYFQPVNLAQGDTLMFVQWSFGDPASGGANTSNQYYPGHTYTSPGNYFVKLKAWNSDNCLDSTYVEVNVPDAPLADFNWDEGVPHCDSTLTLYNLTVTSGAINDSLVWNFGDGTDTTFNAPVPPAVVHRFPRYGFYNISLTAYVANGCTHSIVKRATVKCLTSEFVAADSIACQGMTVTLNDMSAPAGAITSWLWLFGDGEYQQYFTYTPTVTHTFATAGTYSIKLTTTGVVNGQLVQDTISHTVEVLPAPVADFSAVNLCENADVVFTDQSVASNDTIAAWKWLFDDGTLSIDQNPVHRFVGDTARQVQLIVWSGFGCVDTLIREINLGRSPVIYLSPKTGLFCNQDEEITFSDTSHFIYDQYHWIWGDGDSTVTDTSVASHYFEPGEYHVVLRITSADNCGISDTAFIRVKPAPFAEMTITPESASIFNPEFYFTDNSNANNSPIIGWEWQVNGLTFSNAQSVLYDFANTTGNRVIDPDTGNFNITLWVTNFEGCRDSANQVIRIYPELLFQVPNAFTPNGDGLNSHFRPMVKYEMEGTYLLQVYNRWGMLVFETEERDAAWDGNLKGSECPVGVYTWIVTFRLPDGRNYVNQGHVMLLR
ncbi:MAG TPA: hypothetical protein DEO70_11970 [Bacteroidales bacterium]|nr:MAG: hypothetical protein A2X11_09960 [Bacteroidetes bacterium GWE2_42_24]OFY26180.1 MAG: hypothetical protein A2X09_05180 [Bacteroidetes bacterium GWF2_43_11]HBZ67544.1 hypothetical protein [Bacteroidales bacterium]